MVRVGTPPEGIREIGLIELRELHSLAFEEYKYSHTDIWRAQQYFTTLGIGVIGAGVTILKLGGTGDQYATILLFFAGVVFSAFGFLSTIKLRKALERAIAHLTFIQYLLGYYDIKDSSFEKRKLTVHWALSPAEQMKKKGVDPLQNPDAWVAKDTWRVNTIFVYFLIMQVVFGLVDLAAIILICANML